MIQTPKFRRDHERAFWLTEAQVERLKPYFPKSCGKLRVDDRNVLSGIVLIQRNGLRWKHAPAVYGPPKKPYNRWKRWSRMGVFATIMTEPSAQAQQTEIVMIDATHVKVHRTASSLSVKKGGRGRLIGRTKGGPNSKQDVVADARGRPIRMFLSAGQTSDYIGARVLHPPSRRPVRCWQIAATMPTGSATL